MRLEGKVALIAGAGGRQGTTVPILFAREGAAVFLAGLVEEELRRIAGVVAAGGGRAAWLAADLTDPAGAAEAVRRTVETFGRLDILYNNTGAYLDASRRLHDTPPEDWERAFAVNLGAHVQVARHALPHMLAAGRGVIINVAAARAARLGGNTAYGAAKGAVIAMTQSMAKQYRPDNIRVNAICPTNIGESPNPERPGLPEPRLDRDGTPEDVAYAALYLASDEASWVTGITLVVDGGAEVS